MRLTRAAGFLLLGTALLAPAQGQQYVISTYAGGVPPPAPTRSSDQAIGDARALATDDEGNLYFVSFNCIFRLNRSGVITRSPGSPRRVTRATAGRQSTRNRPVQPASWQIAPETCSLRIPMPVLYVIQLWDYLWRPSELPARL